MGEDWAEDEQVIRGIKSFPGENGGLNLYSPKGPARITFEVEVPGGQAYVVLAREQVNALAAHLDRWITENPF